MQRGPRNKRSCWSIIQIVFLSSVVVGLFSFVIEACVCVGLHNKLRWQSGKNKKFSHLKNLLLYQCLVFHLLKNLKLLYNKYSKS